MIRRRRKLLPPVLLMPPWRSFPPLLLARGVSPNQAADWRPERKSVGSGAIAAMTLAAGGWRLSARCPGWSPASGLSNPADTNRESDAPDLPISVPSLFALFCQASQGGLRQIRQTLILFPQGLQRRLYSCWALRRDDTVLPEVGLAMR